MNNDSKGFLVDYFKELSLVSLSSEEELKLIEVAIETIKADDIIEYSEIKFFKVIRSYLKVSNDDILDIHPDFEDYLEEDLISDNYLKRLKDDYFDLQIQSNLKIELDNSKFLGNDDK